MSEPGQAVELYVYDLTLGFAALLAPAIIGRAVEGVWHTAVVAYGREFFYGAHGITSCPPGTTQLGAPQRVERLGETFVPYQVFVDYIRALSATTYTGAAYNLLEHNCNHFSDEVAGFLCGGQVPKHILRQPEELLAGEARAALSALLGSLAPPGGANTQYTPAPAPAPAPRAPAPRRQDSPDYDALNHQIEEARVVSRSLEAQRSTLADKLRRKERRKEKKRNKLVQHGASVPGGETESSMAEAVAEAAAAPAAGPSTALVEEVDERRRAELQRREIHPPIVFKDIDGLVEFEALSRELEGGELSEEDRQSVEELQQYLHGEGSWVLGDEFLAWVGRLLHGQGVKAGVRGAVLRCLAAAALRDDISLLLHQDRRHHALLNYAHSIDSLPLHEQRALALLMCNLCENISASEWLLYISEWDHNGHPLSNIRVTTKVAVHCTLSEDEVLRDVGTALMYNIATKERFQAGKPLRDLLPRRAKAKVFDEVCVELCMALLQLVSTGPGEEALWRALAALACLAHHSADVPQLVAMVGPDPAAYRGTSARVDEQIDAILKKLK